MNRIAEKKALITGGASGIGKLMGRILLEKGLHTLVIWDLNKELLDATSKEFAREGFSVITACLDITVLPAILEAADHLKKDNIQIDMLINNAGIIVGKYFSDHSHEEIDRTLGINTAALMHLSRIFLPEMIQRGNGNIVNIASAAGMIANPKMSVYAASKWAVIGWSDSLRLEMETQKTGVYITTVTPYYINTGMFDGVKSSIIPILDPLKAAKKIISGIEKNKIYVRVPGIVYALPFIKGLLPARWFDAIAGKWLGIYKSMEDFTGRKKAVSSP
jgi:short-subunit dehydrogenase